MLTDEVIPRRPRAALAGRGEREVLDAKRVEIGVDVGGGRIAGFAEARRDAPFESRRQILRGELPAPGVRSREETFDGAALERSHSPRGFGRGSGSTMHSYGCVTNPRR